MLSKRKVIAAAVICGSVAIAGWMMSGGLQKKSVLTEAKAIQQDIRHDAFADRLNSRLVNLARVTTSHSRSVIFDNDAATDDALALILIGNDPGISLKAITVEGTGEAHGKEGAGNMAAIIHMLGKPDVPVAYGHARPLTSAGKSFPVSVREAMDNLLKNTSVKPYPDRRVTDNAVALIKQVVEKSQEKVTILATGPLTNIAEFVTEYPELKNKIERIVVMGGALSVPGNINPLVHDADNAVSEWNFYTDPEAAHRVFASRIPVTLVTLDTASQVPMTKKFYEMVGIEDQPDLRLAHELLQNQIELFGMNRFTNHIYFWDGLAAMVMLDSTLAETKTMPLTIDVTNGQIKMAGNNNTKAFSIDVVTSIKMPDAVLGNYLAMVKSNHLFAQRQFHHESWRVRADFSRQTPAVIGKFERF